MKKIFITLTAAILVTLSLNSFASTLVNPLKSYNSNRIVATYVEMISSGNYEWSEHLLAKDFEYVNDVNKTKNSRSEYLRFLKKNKGLKYDCTSKYEILDEVGNTSIAKATMNFGHFSRVDYITLNRTVDGWQVSKVVTTYP
ncbi:MULTISPECIES: nuclear transport factor 2 family protein [Sphingobacterium]|uniref:Nuclear transport factor 2 family protein n=1 Tax=Sphingobacterium populi TaxID=1812824 RepID=A0ABW5UBP3_9SPHI|nr:nuclear transport factor 2 family protein [Sphingobacterium sp. CFCC 11742]